jgi:hypothetical protein
MAAMATSSRNAAFLPHERLRISSMAQDSDSTGTVLPPNEAAILTSGNMTELELVLPDLGDEDLPEIPISSRSSWNGLSGHTMPRPTRA